MKLSDSARRACIYFIYDKDGIVEDYVVHQIKALREHIEFLHCVINGSLRPEEKNKLLGIVDLVQERENKGCDIGAYKAALAFTGWEKFSEYDELVLMNNTCFGPVYPLKEAFDWSEALDVEFWALSMDTKTLHRDGLGIHNNKSVICYQSYFYVLRKPLLGSKFLKEFFNEIPADASYVDSGNYYEHAFPGYFEERGYRGAVYCNEAEDLNYPLLLNPVQLLRKYRMPLIKKRSFIHHYTDMMNNTGGEATLRLIRFLENETDYDMNLIWKSVLRTSGLADIVRCAQLKRVLPREAICSTADSSCRLGLVYHAFYRELFDEALSFVSNFSELANILLTTGSNEDKRILEEMLSASGCSARVDVIPNRGRDISALLVNAADFVFNHDLICFAHDITASDIEPKSVGRSWRYKLKENTAPSKAFVRNVLDLFEKEEHLGIAFPSYPNHGYFSENLGTGWCGNFGNTQEILKKFGINTKIHEHTLCVAPLGRCFWFRPVALKKIFAGPEGAGWNYDDFPAEPVAANDTALAAIERSFAYFAQEAGFYPVFLYNDEYVRIELSNLELNQSGSKEMRLWMDALTLQYVGVYSQEDVINHVSSGGFGIKQSLRQLAYALSNRFPVVWKLIKPARVVLKKLIRMK